MDAEEIRLLYVAATRAKNLLIISSYDGKPEASPWYDLSKNVDLELEDCQINDDVSETGKGAQIRKEDYYNDKNNFYSPDSTINKPSYHAAPVTKLAKKGRKIPQWDSSGAGRSGGRIIHRVLEACVKEPTSEIELLAKGFLAEEGKDQDNLEHILNLVDNVVNSNLWQRMLKSKQRFSEVPFSTKTKDPETNMETIISGVIDLVFEDEDGWVIVDYKTDSIENEDQIKELTEFYSPQVKMYKEFWQAAAKTKVKEAYIYFIEKNKLMRV